MLRLWLLVYHKSVNCLSTSMDLKVMMYFILPPLSHVYSLLPSLPPSPAGVLGFYLAQLAPVIQYKDLRTDVFQAFKELGNAVIFSLLLEKALGQQEVVDILQAAPFQNLYPKPYVKGNVKLELFLPKNGIT